MLGEFSRLLYVLWVSEARGVLPGPLCISFSNRSLCPPCCDHLELVRDIFRVPTSRVSGGKKSIYSADISSKLSGFCCSLWGFKPLSETPLLTLSSITSPSLLSSSLCCKKPSLSHLFYSLPHHSLVKMECFENPKFGLSNQQTLLWKKPGPCK